MPTLLDRIINETGGEVVTWVTVDQVDRGLCSHHFTVQSGTLGEWGYLNWHYAYPDDNLPKLNEMTESQKYDRNIYFATHLIDSRCHYMVFYYGFNWAFLHGQYRAYLYGFQWDPNQWADLDYLTTMNQLESLYPRFIILPGKFSTATGPVIEGMILHNDLKFSWGEVTNVLYLKGFSGNRMAPYLSGEDFFPQDPPFTYRDKMNIRPTKP